MRRRHRPWLTVGLILAAAPAGFGQEPPAASGYVAPPTSTSYPSGRSTYPGGHESLGSPIPAGAPRNAMASGQGAYVATPQAGAGLVATPYGMIGDQSASGQMVPGGYGAGAPGAGAMGAGAGAGGMAGAGAGAGAMGAGAGAAGMAGAGAAAGAEGMGGAESPGSLAAAAAGSDAMNAALAGLGGPGGATAAESAFPPNMIGDLSPSFRFARPFAGVPTVGPPPLPGVRAASVFAPAIRTLKISENQSPRPQDRVFYNFNYFSNVSQAQNILDRSPVRNMGVFRHVFGFEKTFDEGRGSFGVRLPIDTLTADSRVRGFQTPTSTATGNLNVFAKYILKQNVQTGSLASVGLAVSAPTAPGRFAGAPYVFGMNNTSFQPFVGYILNSGNFYVQGFSSFLFTSSDRDVTMMFNDIGMGYYVYRNNEPDAFLTAFAPSFEVHVNSPFTHRDWKNRFDPAATADIVNLTYGLNFQFGRSALLTTALVTPVTGPRPFDAELAVFLNVFFGRSRAGQIPIQPPVF